MGRNVNTAKTLQEVVRQLLEGYGYENEPYVPHRDQPRIRLGHCTSYGGGGDEERRYVSLTVGGGRQFALRNGLTIDPMSISCEVDIEDLARQIETARLFLAAGPKAESDEDDCCPECGR